jgi:hypothetical protein
VGIEIYSSLHNGPSQKLPALRLAVPGVPGFKTDLQHMSQMCQPCLLTAMLLANLKKLQIKLRDHRQSRKKDGIKVIILSEKNRNG